MLLVFLASGFASMVYEVAWTRILSVVLDSSVYAFAIMLATFLVGLALGSIAALVSVIPVILIILWRVKKEEKMLLDVFGKDYKAYMKRTKKLVPFIY